MFERASAIQARRANGLWLPIMWHLAMRGHGPSQLRLADWYTRDGRFSELGSATGAFGPLGMMRRAYRLGEPYAAVNLALTYFNIGDLSGYRYWLARAARKGDPDAEIELRRFEIRKPHTLARRIWRIRPYRRDGS